MMITLKHYLNVVGTLNLRIAMLSMIFTGVLFMFNNSNTQAQDFDQTNLTGDYYPYSEPPFKYEGNFVLSVTFKTSAEVVRSLVPEPLEPNIENLMSVQFVLRKMISPDRIMYTEASLSIPVKYQGDSGVYFPVRYMETRDAYPSEREILGISHVDAKVNVDQVRNGFRASVSRNDKMLIDFMFDPDKIIRLDPDQFNYKIYHLKVLPSVNNGYTAALKQLVSVKRKDIIVESSREGTARLFFDSLPLDPLGKIPVRQIVDAKYYKISFTMDSGEVVYDYQKDKDFSSRGTITR